MGTAAAPILFLEKPQQLGVPGLHCLLHAPVRTAVSEKSLIQGERISWEKDQWVVISCKSSETNISFQNSKYQTAAF